MLQWAVPAPFWRPGSRPPDKGESSSTSKLQLSPQSCGLSRGVYGGDVGGPRPRQGGRSPEDRVAPCLSPERTGAHSTSSSQGWA